MSYLILERKFSIIIRYVGIFILWYLIHPYIGILPALFSLNISESFAVHICMMALSARRSLVHSCILPHQKQWLNRPPLPQHYRFFSDFIIWCASVIKKPDLLICHNKARPGQYSRFDNSLRGKMVVAIYRQFNFKVKTFYIWIFLLLKNSLWRKESCLNFEGRPILKISNFLYVETVLQYVSRFDNFLMSELYF